jgi:hypothetical protein
MVSASISRSSADFDFSLGRVFAVYAYVSRRVRERKACARIVREVLVANRDLLVNGMDATHELDQLVASLDRLIGRESATDRATD